MKIDKVSFRISHEQGDYICDLDKIHDGRFKAAFGHNGIYWLVEAEEVVAAYLEEHWPTCNQDGAAFADAWERSDR